VSPLLSNDFELCTWPEPATGNDPQASFAVMCLPPGKARLRLPVVAANYGNDAFSYFGSPGLLPEATVTRNSAPLGAECEPNL
jgi:hypothetical protein